MLTVGFYLLRLPFLFYWGNPNHSISSSAAFDVAVALRKQAHSEVSIQTAEKILFAFVPKKKCVEKLSLVGSTCCCRVAVRHLGNFYLNSCHVSPGCDP